MHHIFCNIIQQRYNDLTVMSMQISCFMCVFRYNCISICMREILTERLQRYIRSTCSSIPSMLSVSRIAIGKPFQNSIAKARIGTRRLCSLAHRTSLTRCATFHHNRSSRDNQGDDVLTAI